MRDKPGIGLLLLSAEWFTTIRAGCGCFSLLPSFLKKDVSRIKKILSSEFQPVCPFIVDTRKKAAAIAEIFQKEKVVAILICYLTWGEDYLFLDVIKRLPEIPIILWSYFPLRKLPRQFNMVQLFRFSGPVASLQASGPLKRAGTNFGVVSGSLENSEAAQQLKDYLKAASIIFRLKSLTVGLLPCPSQGMSGIYIDPQVLKEQLGVSIQKIKVEEYYRMTESISQKEIKENFLLLKQEFRVEVSDAALWKGVRASLGLLKIVEKYQLHALALNDLDVQLHKKLGLRPCLWIPGLLEKTVISMEGDVGAAVALYLLRELSKKVPMYTEIFTLDEQKNIFLAGHAGIHDIRLADSKENIKITPDHEYMEVEKETSAMQFKAKKGRVTMLNLFFDGKKLQMTTLTGKALAGRETFSISPYMLIKPSLPVNEIVKLIIQQGVTQHWAVVHQDVSKQLEYLKKLLGNTLSTRQE